MDSFRLYGKLIHQADDSSDDETDNLEQSVYETNSSELDNDSLGSSSDQSYGEFNTIQDDKNTSDSEDQLINHKEGHKMPG